MRHSLLYHFLALAALLCAATQAEETLMWQMDLQNHEDGKAPELGEGLEIRTENGAKFLSKIEPGSIFFPLNIPPHQATKDWNNIIFQVRYRETEPYGITLVVKRHGTRGEANYLWYYVAIRKDRIDVNCHGLSQDASIDPEDPRLKSSVKYEDIGEAPLVTGEWITAEAQVGEDVIKVFVTTEDGSVRKAEFPTLPGTGGVNILAHKPLDVLSATVRDAGKEITATK